MENTKKDEEKIGKESYKYKVGTLGNFILLFLLFLILGTGILIYYLLHVEKERNEIQNNSSSNQIDKSLSEDETIANMIGSVISNVVDTSSISNTIDNSSKKTMNEELVVLYNGLLLDTSKMDEINLNYIDTISEDVDKYVITYYSYENFSFSEAKLGTISSIYDGKAKVDNVGKIAISEDYNAIPRTIKVINTAPSIVLEKNPRIAEYDSVKTIITDLDGNGTDEYLLVLVNKEKGTSKISLVSFEGNSIADLAFIDKNNIGDINQEYYFNINNIEVIDIDNDGIMEILLEIPQSSTEYTVSILKYSNGDLFGKTNIKGFNKKE